METILKRKVIHLSADVLERLAEMAKCSGKTLKSYMESILTLKASKNSVSPSNDPWFDDERNIKMVQEGIEQLKAGRGKIYTADELNSRFGL